VAGWQQVVVTLAVGRATATFRYEPVSSAAPTPPQTPVTPVVDPGAPTVHAASAARPSKVTTITRGNTLAVTWSLTGPVGPHSEYVSVFSGKRLVKRVGVPVGASRVTVRGLKKGVSYTVTVTTLVGGKRLTSAASRPVRLVA